MAFLNNKGYFAIQVLTQQEVAPLVLYCREIVAKVLLFTKTQ